MSLAEKVEVAQTGSDKYMVEGSFGLEEAGLMVTMMLRRTSDLKELHQEAFHFKNVIDAADSLSLVLRDWLDIDLVIMEREMDLPLSSFMTENQEAYKYYVQEDLLAAIDLDSGFAIATAQRATTGHYYQDSRLAALGYIKLAMKYIDQLPKRYRNEILADYYLINHQPDKALRILNNVLKLKPKDLEILDQKANILRTNLDPEYVTVMDNIESLRGLTIEEQFQIAILLMVNGEPDDAFQRVTRYEASNPSVIWVLTKGILRLANRDFDLAQGFFEDFKLQHPDDPEIDRYLEAVRFARETNKETYSDLLNKFVGTYQHESSEMRISNLSFERFGFNKAINQEGYLTFLLNDSTTFYYWNPPGRGKSFLKIMAGKDENGVYLIKEYQTNYFEATRSFHNLFWKTDATIDSAKTAILNKEYTKANTYLAEAIQKFPNHYFLKDYLLHVEFMTNEAFEKDRLKLQSIVGEYDYSWSINYSSGTYFASAIGRPTWVVLPLSLSRIKVLDDETIHLEFDWEDGNVKGIKVKYLDFETMEYIDPWFVARIN